MSRPAPIVVFAYKRHDHLRRTIQSLQTNALATQSDLYVYCDAARSPADALDVEAVRSFARGITGFASVTVHGREANLGLAKSVIQGVGELLQRHDRLIVLEDDLLLSPHFLAYMNEALAFYEQNERVASIHGYCYPVQQPLPPTFFLRGADCWGWATWRRAWATFRTDGRALLAELENRRRDPVPPGPGRGVRQPLPSLAVPCGPLRRTRVRDAPEARARGIAQAFYDGQRFPFVDGEFRSQPGPGARVQLRHVPAGDPWGPAPRRPPAADGAIRLGRARAALRLRPLFQLRPDDLAEAQWVRRRTAARTPGRFQPGPAAGERLSLQGAADPLPRRQPGADGLADGDGPRTGAGRPAAAQRRPVPRPAGRGAAATSRPPRS